MNLYSAINGSNYTDKNDIEINTIDNVVYMKMKNDVSFLVDDALNLYEQQSSYNPNMPMRFLIYAGMLYDKYVRQRKIYLYSSNLKPMPTPRCVCFYNGSDDKEDRFVLKLSDCFKEGSNPDIEVTVLMININYGRNKELLDACRPLNDYSWFVTKVTEKQRDNTRNLTLKQAIDEALDEMPDDSVIKEFLLDNRADVTRMCITEYNEEEALAQRWEEGREEGREEGLGIGLLRGVLLTLADLVQDGILTTKQAAQKAKMSEEEFETKLAALKGETQLI